MPKEDRVGMVDGTGVPHVGAVDAAVAVIPATIFAKAKTKHFSLTYTTIMQARVSASMDRN